MRYTSLTMKILLAAISTLACATAVAIPVDYVITFTQTYFVPSFESRLLVGNLSIDSSVVDLAHANTVYGPNASELQYLYSYTVTLSPSLTYTFNQSQTAAIVEPPVTSVIRTNSSGTIVDLQGAFTLPGTLSEIILGRVGREGTFVDIQQIDRFTSVVVSSGTYHVSLATSVPEPTTAATFIIGLFTLLSVSKFRRFNMGLST